MLCPNCNSQTKTFAGRNAQRKKTSRICGRCGGKITWQSKLGLWVKCAGQYRSEHYHKCQYKCDACGVILKEKRKLAADVKKAQKK